MKTKLLISGLLLNLVLVSPMVFAECGSCSSGCMNSYPSDACASSSGGCFSSTNCACADPVCSQKTCMDRGSCCEVYGNIGRW